MSFYKQLCCYATKFTNMLASVCFFRELACGIYKERVSLWIFHTRLFFCASPCYRNPVGVCKWIPMLQQGSPCHCVWAGCSIAPEWRGLSFALLVLHTSRRDLWRQTKSLLFICVNHYLLEDESETLFSPQVSIISTVVFNKLLYKTRAVHMKYYIYPNWAGGLSLIHTRV